MLVAFCLSLTAEQVQSRVLLRHFKWHEALLRFLAALPMMVAPLYACSVAIRVAVPVASSVARRPPALWVEKELAFCLASAGFAYLALGIKKQPKQLP